MKVFAAQLVFHLLLFGFSTTAFGSDESRSEPVKYDVVSQGTRELKRPDGSDFVKILVEDANLNGHEVEVAEVTFRPNYRGSGHSHGSMEIFYVLSGQLTHVVNGHGAQLQPGMVGIVRPGDVVEHINETESPVKTLVIWVPGGEIQRALGDTEMAPIDPLAPQEYPEKQESE